MSETDQPEAPDRPGVARFITALHVRRNAAIGFAISILVAAIFTHGTIVGADGPRPDAAYLALGFVLAVGLGLLLAAIFTLGSAIRLARAE
ncbi:DUF7536 family protein [Halosegnis rubeus]|uniref:DUF7536 family protein n=1 Tax=Halosegnis rubeus TaxID=2212850 RepID=UPI0015624A02|nr:hypothetical protein [Halosegnis rubeus]